MQTGPEKQMISMFEEAIELSSQFKKATYERLSVVFLREDARSLPGC